MNHFLLFTDASVSASKGSGVGASLVLHHDDFKKLPKNESLEPILSEDIQVHRFNTCKANVAELMTFISALQGFDLKLPGSIDAFSDSKTLLDLVYNRRARLEACGFRKRNGELLNHHELYKRLLDVVDKQPVQIHKVRGHMPARSIVDDIDRVFRVVDKAARKALRSL